MSRFADMTVEQWIGFVGFFFFAAVLVWSLTRSRKPPADRP
jgi:hypothetical protein